MQYLGENTEMFTFWYRVVWYYVYILVSNILPIHYTIYQIFVKRRYNIGNIWIKLENFPIKHTFLVNNV